MKIINNLNFNNTIDKSSPIFIKSNTFVKKRLKVLLYLEKKMKKSVQISFGNLFINLQIL